MIKSRLIGNRGSGWWWHRRFFSIIVISGVDSRRRRSVNLEASLFPAIRRRKSGGESSGLVGQQIDGEIRIWRLRHQVFEITRRGGARLYGEFVARMKW